MINKPKFKSCFHIEVVEPETVLLLSERGHRLLSGRLYRLLAPYIDGSRTVSDMIQLLRGQASAAEVYYTLMRLEEKGYIVEADDSVSSEIAAFSNLLDMDVREVLRRLQETKVAITSFGAVPTTELIFTLAALNIQVGEEGDIGVVLTDDYLQVGLDAFNRQALKSEQPWMLIKPVGTVIWIGPIFRPGKTGCWECLSQRLRSNRSIETFIQEQKGFATPLPIYQFALPSTIQTALNMAGTEIAKWIASGENKSLEGVVMTLDVMSLTTQNHVLVQRPQCPQCSEPEHWSNRKPIPLVLESRKKMFTQDGGHRCLSPQETLRQYEHHVSPIIGAVSAMKQTSEEGNDFIHVYLAVNNRTIKTDSLSSLRAGLRRSCSGGKGKTEHQACASALCEALERYSGIFQGNEIRKATSYSAMGDETIHPNTCMNFSEEQYKHRREWNKTCGNYQRVPDPFDEEMEVEWTPVWSLTSKEFKYLPTAYCYYDYPLSQEHRFCRVDSNGNAAGNAIEEAILQGFMELVERDSVALWWYNRVQRPAVDLDSFDEPYFQALKAYYQTIHRDFWVLDVTSDVNIPVFVAISRRTDQEREEIIFGFGAHFDPKIGILRALTEMNQCLLWLSGGNDDGKTHIPSN